MVIYSELKEGIYKEDGLMEEQVWQIFTEIFDVSTSVKVASYKHALIYSILQCLRLNKNQNRFTFKEIFIPFIKIYWKLIIHHQLFQISKNNLSSIYKILNQFLIENPLSRSKDFNDIDNQNKEILLKETITKCSRYVFGALFGDSDEFFYSFSKSKKFLEINPIFKEFLFKYGKIIEKVNIYEWLKFLQSRNPERVIPITLFEIEFNETKKLRFEDIWAKIRIIFEPPIAIFTLKQQKPNEILEINDAGIIVKTDKSTELVKIELIKKAWENLVTDRILYRDEHERSTYRSSFILALFSQFEFIESNIKGRTSIKLKI